jgi:tyrosyl-tRNA synthetase
LGKEEIEMLVAEHNQAPHLRSLQKRLAAEMTRMVHSPEDLTAAMEATDILFGKGTTETLKKLDEGTFLSVFEGVPMYRIEPATLQQGINIADLLGEMTEVFPSKGEARRMIKGGGVSINKGKIENDSHQIGQADLLNGKYILVQKGKKNYYLITTQ